MSNRPKVGQFGLRHLLFGTTMVCLGLWFLRLQIYGPQVSFPELGLYGLLLIGGGIGTVCGRLYWGTTRGAKIGFWLGGGISLYLLMVLCLVMASR